MFVVEVSVIDRDSFGSPAGSWCLPWFSGACRASSASGHLYGGRQSVNDQSNLPLFKAVRRRPFPTHTGICIGCNTYHLLLHHMRPRCVLEIYSSFALEGLSMH